MLDAFAPAFRELLSLSYMCLMNPIDISYLTIFFQCFQFFPERKGNSIIKCSYAIVAMLKICP